MMDRAMLFGSLGLAVVEQGDEVLLCRVTDQEPKPVSAQEVSLVLHSGAEYRELTNKKLTIKGLRAALRHESDQQRALDCAISAIDRRLSDETRVISIEQLDRHLSVYMKRRFLENRLLGRPVPDGADIKGARALSQHGLRVGRLLEEMERLKRHIDTFYKAWRESAENLSAEDKETILWLLVEHGVVTQIARSLYKTDYKGLKAVLEGLHGARFLSIGTYDLINNLYNTLIPEGDSEMGETT